ncbi:MAG: phosphomannomutase/phosphoglucomutase [Rhodanobacter denitrificans]|uniref:phosphomannomutase n=1 Tax=Rhodanobacter denitrificans TaxID=666685 RepID=A0A2W5MC67_9GAMM|nr:MAG: phosphomannomutase/phosphoglucomutase [Rhodanobacter denitrificans]
MGSEESAKARRRLPRLRYRPNPRVLLGVAAATALFISAGFLAWQTWLILRERSGSAAADTLRGELVAEFGKQIADRRRDIEAALASPPIARVFESPMPDLTMASGLLKASVSDVGTVRFYDAALGSVLVDDLADVGYARAALLMRAQSDAAPTVAALRQEKGKPPVLLQVWPVAGPSGEPARAYLLAEWPAQALLDRFSSFPLVGARLELRQGDGRSDQLLRAIGDGEASALSDAGQPIAGSDLRIGKAPPNYFITVPRSPLLISALTVLCLLGGLAALWLRKAGIERAMGLLRRQPHSQESTLLSDVIKQQPKPETPASVPAAPAAAAAAPTPPAEDSWADPSIFRTYDIRGVVGQTLTRNVARSIGRAIGSEARSRGLSEIVVGRDGRLSGPELSAALIEGLRASGLDVIDIGLAPTPVVYFACYHLNTGSGVAVTGSHNPPDYNGFKIVLGGETLAEAAIQKLYERIRDEDYVDGSGGLQSLDVSREYVDRIADDIQVQRRLKVVVDCGNGVPGAIAPAVLEAIGCEVMPLYCDVDGTFPNHHPDPSELHNLQDLILTVKNTNADVGLAFDGDGDRLGVVTKTGEVIFPDRLLMLFAADVLTRVPGATIIYDVKCTGKLQQNVLQNGGVPLMWKTGHSLIKSKMRDTGAELAGEMSGHFFFKERWYGFDDGIYAAARLMEILAGDLDERTPKEIFDALPNSVSTPELKIPMQEGQTHRFIATFQSKARFDGARLTTIDGVRADWPDGWGLVRASNTTPVLVLRFDADSADALRRIQDAFRTQLLAIEPELKLPF